MCKAKGYAEYAKVKGFLVYLNDLNDCVEGPPVGGRAIQKRQDIF